MPAPDRISIEQSLRWTQRFARREWQLALPVALAFIALPSLVSSLLLARFVTAVPRSAAEMELMAATLPWWLTPVVLVLLLAMLTGGLALIALALLPQVSVGEAIRVGFGRLAAVAATVVLLWAATMLVMIVIGVAITALALAPGLIAAAALVATAAATIYLLLLLPLIVDRRASPLAAIRASRRMYRGTAPRVVAAILLYLVVTAIAALAAQLALGSVAMLIATIAGATEIGQLFVALISAVVAALQGGGLFLLLAAFYRQRVGRT